MLSYLIAKMKIFIPLCITTAVRQTAKDTEFNYFLCYSTLNCEHFGIQDFMKRLQQARENITTN